MHRPMDIKQHPYSQRGMKIFTCLTEHTILCVSHLCFFLENIKAPSDDQNERFHHNMARLEQQYQVRWDPSMTGYCCWLLCREDETSHKRRK